MSIEIGNIKISDLAALDVSVSVSEIGPESYFTSLNGTSIKQSGYKKLEITISGSGWVPAPFRAMDCNVKQVLKLDTIEAIPASETLTAGTYRTDTGFEPFVSADLDGCPIEVPLVGNSYTLPQGAVNPMICYFPQYNVWVSRPKRGSTSAGEYSWELVCRE